MTSHLDIIIAVAGGAGIIGLGIYLRAMTMKSVEPPKPLAQMSTEEKEERIIAILNRLGALRKEEGMLSDELFLLKESMS